LEIIQAYLFDGTATTTVFVVVITPIFLTIVPCISTIDIISFFRLFETNRSSFAPSVSPSASFTFEAEYRSLLLESGLEIDERYFDIKDIEYSDNQLSFLPHKNYCNR